VRGSHRIGSLLEEDVQGFEEHHRLFVRRARRDLRDGFVHRWRRDRSIFV